MHTKAESDRVKYRKSCRDANKLIMQSLQNKFSSDIEEASGNSRTLWKAVNKLLHPPSSQPEAYTDDSCQKRCHDIGNFFMDKVTKLKDVTAQKLSARGSHELFEDQVHDGARMDFIGHFSPEEVGAIIKETMLKFSPVDVIPSSLIKLCPDIFAVLISRLANLSFQRGTFPASFKTAQVKPLLKKQGLDMNKSANYRPISNLDTISKILEKLFLARIKPYVVASENFCRLQSVYRDRYSTETALLKIFNDIYRSVDKKLGTVLVTLDISATFDCVIHDVLLKRLEVCYGISGLPLAWIASYLQNRTQYIKIQDARSDMYNISTGVPQGSGLGPFLFCV